MTTGAKRDAANALWHALEERRENLRAEKLWTGRTEQQHRKLEAAYDDGWLIDALVDGAQSPYRGRERLGGMALSRVASKVGADADWP